jgi:hypothetical protein
MRNSLMAIFGPSREGDPRYEQAVVFALRDLQERGVTHTNTAYLKDSITGRCTLPVVVSEHPNPGGAGGTYWRIEVAR